MGKRVIERILYTEVVYYNDQGEEVFREHLQDDTLFESETYYVSDDELSEYL